MFIKKAMFFSVLLSLLSLNSFAQESCQLELFALRAVQAETPSLEIKYQNNLAQLGYYRSSYQNLNCDSLFRYRTDERSAIVACAARTVQVEIQQEWISDYREEVRSSFETSLGADSYRSLFENQSDPDLVFSRLHGMLDSGSQYGSRLARLAEARDYLQSNCRDYTSAAISEYIERNENIKACIRSLRGRELHLQAIEELSLDRHRTNLEHARENYFSCVQGVVGGEESISTTEIQQ